MQIDKLKRLPQKLNMTKLSEMVKTIRQMNTLHKRKPMLKEKLKMKKLSENGSKSKLKKTQCNNRLHGRKNKPKRRRETKLKNKLQLKPLKQKP